MTIDALITGLSKELELSAEEIADTLWLALQIEEYEPELSVRAELRENPAQPPNPPPAPPRRGATSGEPETNDLLDSEEIGSNQPPDEPKAGIYPRNPQESLVGSGLSLRVPDAPSLREPLTLARALKPLMRRMPSGTMLVLDEAATTQQIAETGLWLPVLKPTLEPWLDLELVVDEGISMQIWRHTIGELERLLKNYGIFRDVRVWGLIADDSEASDLPNRVQIRRGIGATAKDRSPRSPAELIDLSGRRLILVVSDCVSPQWRDGKLTKTLELWAKQGSMAIVQMLPKWLWKRTALGRASEVRLQGLNPGEFNQKLIAKGVSLWDELEETRGVKVPIFTLEPDRVATWAQMLSGKGSSWTVGYVFKLDPIPVRQGKDLFNLDVERQSAEQRVQAFRVTASPMARKLAGLLAAAPVINLPIVRLIQETLLKESQQVHVAEVFLGGLLKPLSEINPETNPNYVQYEFMDGVRELLADSVPSGYVLDVVDAVSKYVVRKLGWSLEYFAAVLQNPQQIGDGEVAENVGYFATMTAQVLKQLGGEYERFGEELERCSQLNSQDFIEDLHSNKINRNQTSSLEDRSSHNSSISKNLNILFVNDDKTLLTVLDRYMSRRGYKFNFVHSGKQALKEISNKDYDIIFMNNRMPGFDGTGIDGTETTKRIRRQEGGDRHTIIIGWSRDFSEFEYLINVGLDDYISMSYEPIEYINKIMYYGRLILTQNESLSAIKIVKKTKRLNDTIIIEISKNIAILNHMNSTSIEKNAALKKLGKIAKGVNSAISWILSLIQRDEHNDIIVEGITALSEINDGRSSQ